jgi:hypothetical protein
LNDEYCNEIQLKVDPPNENESDNNFPRIPEYQDSLASKMQVGINEHEDTNPTEEKMLKGENFKKEIKFFMMGREWKSVRKMNLDKTEMNLEVIFRMKVTHSQVSRDSIQF